MSIALIHNGSTVPPMHSCIEPRLAFVTQSYFVLTGASIVQVHACSIVLPWQSVPGLEPLRVAPAPSASIADFGCHRGLRLSGQGSSSIADFGCLIRDVSSSSRPKQVFGCSMGLVILVLEKGCSMVWHRASFRTKVSQLTNCPLYLTFGS
jgi:hypothetical protein